MSLVIGTVANILMRRDAFVLSRYEEGQKLYFRADPLKPRDGMLGLRPAATFSLVNKSEDAIKYPLWLMACYYRQALNRAMPHEAAICIERAPRL